MYILYTHNPEPGGKRSPKGQQHFCSGNPIAAGWRRQVRGSQQKVSFQYKAAQTADLPEAICTISPWTREYFQSSSRKPCWCTVLGFTQPDRHRNLEKKSLTHSFFQNRCGIFLLGRALCTVGPTASPPWWSPCPESRQRSQQEAPIQCDK